MEGFDRSTEKWGTELSEVVKDLLQKEESEGLKQITSAPREYRIRLPITPEALKSLSRLSFEVFLTEHNAGTTLVTGGVDIAWLDPHTGPRTADEARYTLHNHPGATAASPTISDLERSQIDKSDVDFIVGAEGITVHKLLPESRNLFVGSKVWEDPDKTAEDEHEYIEKDIARELIDAWIPWGDPRVQDICNYINGKVEWSDVKERIRTP